MRWIRVDGKWYENELPSIEWMVSFFTIEYFGIIIVHRMSHLIWYGNDKFMEHWQFCVFFFFSNTIHYGHLFHTDWHTNRCKYLLSKWLLLIREIVRSDFKLTFVEFRWQATCSLSMTVTQFDFAFIKLLNVMLMYVYIYYMFHLHLQRVSNFSSNC